MPDSLGTYLWLSLSALAGGGVNAVAGGGTILTFPALIAALTPSLGVAAAVMANATSTTALVPGSFAGAWAFRREIKVVWRWIILLVGPSVIGGLIGSLLVTRLPDKYFAALVPWLILVAALLFALQPVLLRRRVPQEYAQPSVRAQAAIVAFQLLVAIYGGYFGAGIGILMLSALGLMGIPDIHQMNAVKNVLAACINGVSVVVFVLSDKVVWPYAAAMAVSAVIGAYLGGRFARRLPKQVVRGIVTAIGFTLAGYYFYRQLAG